MNRRTWIPLVVYAILTGLPVQGQEWQLVWSDEFEGTELDNSKWSYQTGTGTEYGLESWGNNEEQYYREENVKVEEGNLVITARQQSFGGKGYTSGRIRTLGKGDWTYGRVEFRAKMPRGQGLWAAVWMLPTDEVYGGWAASGEIDIMEFLGHETTKVHGTLHFGGAYPNNQYKGTSFETTGWPFSSEFHEFAMEWEEGEMRWYVDGILYQTLGEGDWNTSGHPFPAPFDQRFHLLVNLAVGGNWPGSPDASTDFPQELVLEYIRVYQREATGSGDLHEERHGTFRLSQNVPNPVSGNTTILLQLPRKEQIRIEVFDIAGRKVCEMLEGFIPAGDHSVNFDTSLLEPGIYGYRLTAGSFHAHRQMQVL